MLIQSWLVGLDIQPHVMYATALQRRRTGWQLRRWWRLPLPEGVCDERLRQPRLLGECLRAWRRELPARARVRLGLPPTQVMQRTLLRPERRLPATIRQEALRLAVQKQFHLSCEEMAYDYAPASESDLTITAARHQDVQSWLEAMAIAGLRPEIIDITPCALRRVAMFCATPPDKLLLHQTERALLWAAPHPQSLAFGSVETTNEAEATEGESAIIVAQRQAGQAGVTVNGYLLSGGCQQGENDNGWSPLCFLQRLQPPLPRQPQMFTLALGLALHPGASSWI